MRRRADRRRLPALRRAERWGAGWHEPRHGDHPRAPAAKGLGLHNDLQNESSIVGNFPTVTMFDRFGTAAAESGVHRRHHHRHAARRLRAHRAEPRQRRHLAGDARRARWRRLGDQRREALQQRAARATHDMVFARTSGEAGNARASAPSSCRRTPGLRGRLHVHWTFNMPSDHAEVRAQGRARPRRARSSAREGDGLALAQLFVHENRIRQAASGVGAAQYCIDASVAYARQRMTFGQPLVDAPGHPVAARRAADRVRAGARPRPQDGLGSRPQAPYRAERPGLDVQLPREPARLQRRRPRDAGARGHRLHAHKPFEHIYRHHRRYRITEGSEEIQLRKIAGHLFGFMALREAESPRGKRTGQLQSRGAPIRSWPSRTRSAPRVGRTRSMAKLSQVLRDRRRKKLIEKHAATARRPAREAARPERLDRREAPGPEAVREAPAQLLPDAARSAAAGCRGARAATTGSSASRGSRCASSR